MTRYTTDGFPIPDTGSAWRDAEVWRGIQLSRLTRRDVGSTAHLSADEFRAKFGHDSIGPVTYQLMKEEEARRELKPKAEVSR